MPRLDNARCVVLRIISNNLTNNSTFELLVTLNHIIKSPFTSLKNLLLTLIIFKSMLMHATFSLFFCESVTDTSHSATTLFIIVILFVILWVRFNLSINSLDRIAYALLLLFKSKSLTSDVYLLFANRLRHGQSVKLFDIIIYCLFVFFIQFSLIFNAGMIRGDDLLQSSYRSPSFIHRVGI